MKNITIKLIKDYSEIFRNCTDFPPFVDPNVYLEYFQKKIDAKLIAFAFPDVFSLDILKELKDNIYNSFYLFRSEGGANLMTYFQFSAENHAVCQYVNNQKTNKDGILMTFYVRDHSFVLEFIKKYEKFITDEEKPVGFLGMK